MNFDEMLKTWRAQDEAPLYGVNRDLLQLVVQHEQADLRRTLRRNMGRLLASARRLPCLALLFALLFAAIYYDDIARRCGTTWRRASARRNPGVGRRDWVSRKRQARRERGFGNSLQEEIRRNLSLVDYQLSWEGQLASLLMYAPMWMALMLSFWIVVRISGKPFGWLLPVGCFFFIVPWWVMWSVWFKKQLLAYRHRFSQLLELLNPGE